MANTLSITNVLLQAQSFKVCKYILSELVSYFNGIDTLIGEIVYV